MTSTGELAAALDIVSTLSAELAGALRAEPMDYEQIADLSARLSGLLVHLGNESARWTLLALKELRSRN